VGEGASVVELDAVVMVVGVEAMLALEVVVK